MARIFNDFGMPVGFGQPALKQKKQTIPSLSGVPSFLNEQTQPPTTDPNDPRFYTPNTPSTGGVEGGKVQAPPTSPPGYDASLIPPVAPTTPTPAPTSPTTLPPLFTNEELAKWTPPQTDFTGYKTPDPTKDLAYLNPAYSILPTDPRTTPVEEAQAKIVEAYQKHLGRTPSAQEIMDQLKGGQSAWRWGYPYYKTPDLISILNSIAASEEAKKYTESQKVVDTPTSDTTTPSVTGSGSVLPGWDSGKWADTSHTTPKYVAGRIFSDYNPSDWLDPTKQTEIINKMIAAGLNPSVVDEDEISLDGQLIDILQNAEGGGGAWQWLTEEDQATSGQGSSGGGAPYLFDTSNIDVNSPTFGQSIIQKLLALLNTQRGG